MKRIQYCFLIVIALLLLSACTGKTEQTDTSDNSQNCMNSVENRFICSVHMELEGLPAV